jgi:hypothetical protein
MCCSIILLVPECLSLSFTLHNRFCRLYFPPFNIGHIAKYAICFYNLLLKLVTTVTGIGG